MLMNKFTEEIMPTGMVYNISDNSGKVYMNVLFTGIDTSLGKPILKFKTKDKRLILLNLSYLAGVEECLP